MRRAKNLFERIVARDNLRRAYLRAVRGKRNSRDARVFGTHLEGRLDEMARQVSAGQFPLGRSTQFVIHDPKERIITAPCFAERVLHHAIMGVCEPVFERWLIDDTFACRVGRGRIAAIWRAQEFAGGAPYFLKLDIRKYFDSVSHAVLLQRLARLVKDRQLLRLFERLVAAYRAQSGRGLPIGSLTSQHFANFYLGWFDRFVKEKLRCRHYVRYMDDMILWGPSQSQLSQTLMECHSFLRNELQLECKPEPYINRSRHGVDFLGCRIFPHHFVLNRRSRVRARRRLLVLERLFLDEQITESELQRRATAVVAFLRAGGCASWKFRRSLVEQLPVGGQ